MLRKSNVWGMIFLGTILFIVSACGGKSSGFSSPTSSIGDVALWRNNRVFGPDANQAPPLLEIALQSALNNYGFVGQGLEPNGDLTIILVANRFECPGAGTFDGKCSGTFNQSTLTVTIAWDSKEVAPNRPRDERFIAVADHELCHYLTFRKTGNPRGPGCIS